MNSNQNRAANTSKKCTVSGCKNTTTANREKHFFWSPANQEQRELWKAALGVHANVIADFLVCQDHFDVSIHEIWKHLLKWSSTEQSHFYFSPCR